MRKTIVCATFVFALSLISNIAFAASASPQFWAQIKDGGKRLEVFAANTRDSNFRCDLNVQFETADGTPGNFLCKAQVYGKTKEALVCSDNTRGQRFTAIGPINQFCNLN